MNRLEWLEKQHKNIHKVIEQLESLQHKDDYTIQTISHLKKKKLQIKDEISRVTNAT